MSPGLCVIALISGGKDSLFSILHCQAQGHKVVALANLFPPTSQDERKNADTAESGPSQATDDDLNSFMYQTVGHTVIPLYEEALGIPLYRQEIRGSAINDDVSYALSADLGVKSSEEDETESLIPLLRKVKEAHPEANAVSTGAILSHYQRTRVESIAIRLNLVPLSYLWQFPSLAPGTPTSLLDDMQSVGQDARIIKVASGGLDAGHLWENVASAQGKRRLVQAMRRYGEGEGGAVLGEGGEFETLAIDGPPPLWKSRVEVHPDQRIVVNEGAGSALLRITGAELVPKEKCATATAHVPELRVPNLLDANSDLLLKSLLEVSARATTIRREEPTMRSSYLQRKDSVWSSYVGPTTWFISNMIDVDVGDDVEAQMESIIQRLRSLLAPRERSPDDIVFTTILLRSMESFTKVNHLYATLFAKPNPPARVTVAVGDALPAGADVMVSVVLDLKPESSRKCLHVQSRSYWAPANIGPYSQAISVKTVDSSTEGQAASTDYFTHVAGQIPLVPATMEVVIADGPPSDPLQGFCLQSVLSLQHLWRVGRAMNVDWWATGVAFITGEQDVEAKARLAWKTWTLVNEPSKDRKEDGTEAEDMDVWDQRYGVGHGTPTPSDPPSMLPNFAIIESRDSMHLTPPFCAVLVEELPRGCEIEWAASGLSTDRLSFTIGKAGEMCAQLNSSSNTEPVVIHATLPDACPDEHIDESFATLVDPKRLSTSLDLRDTKLEVEHITVYTSRAISALSSVASYTLIPCKAVWGPGPSRIAADITIRCRDASHHPPVAAHSPL